MYENRFRLVSRQNWRRPWALTDSRANMRHKYQAGIPLLNSVSRHAGGCRGKICRPMGRPLERQELLLRELKSSSLFVAAYFQLLTYISFVQLMQRHLLFTNTWTKSAAFKICINRDSKDDSEILFLLRYLTSMLLY